MDDRAVGSFTIRRIGTTGHEILANGTVNRARSDTTSNST